MIARLSSKYQWVGLKKSVKEYVKRCEICQKNKYSKQHRVPMQITTTAHRPMERLALDIVGPLPETQKGNKYLLTYQDDLTKYVGAIPIPNQEAETVARAFVQYIILRFGMNGNMSVLSDQGSNFQSELFTNVCKMLKIKKQRTSAWHPESNGSLERSHRTMKEYLRTVVNEDSNDWDDFIEYCIFTMNTTRNRATGYSPFELIYGYQAEIPSSFKTMSVRYNYDDYIYELKYKLQRAHQLARERQLEEKNVNKKFYDRKAKELEIKVGDKVLLLNTSKRGEGRKLQSLYVGPYEVVEIVSETNVKLRIGKKIKVVHKNLIKKFIE
jgi:transposase InsO family protein